MGKIKPEQKFPWTPQLAYAIGLLATDGNLSKDGRHITMRSSDPDLLQAFISCLKLESKIIQSFNNGFAKKASYRVQFSDTRFYRWLLIIGLFPAKTYTLGEIKVPDQYFRDFLRGHLDGDGSVYTYIDKYNFYKNRNYINQRVYVKFISASQIHINWLYNTLNRISGIKGTINSTKPHIVNHVPIWGIKFSKKESIKILTWIYYQPDLPSLQRKLLIAKQILETIPFEKRKIYERTDT